MGPRPLEFFSNGGGHDVCVATPLHTMGIFKSPSQQIVYLGTLKFLDLVIGWGFGKFRNRAQAPSSSSNSQQA